MISIATPRRFASPFNTANMPRPAALLVALLASVAAAQQSVNMGFGKPPKNQRPAGPVKPNENFPWKDPFTPAAKEAYTSACAARGTFAAQEFLLDDLELDPPLGLGPYAPQLRGFFAGRAYPGGWDGLDPHGYDRNVLLMDEDDVPAAVRAWIRDQEASEAKAGNGLFAVWPKHGAPDKKVVIFAPGAVYGILPLWVAEQSDCQGTCKSGATCPPTAWREEPRPLTGFRRNTLRHGLLHARAHRRVSRGLGHGSYQAEARC